MTRKPAAHAKPVARLTPAQHDNAVAAILEIVDETLLSMERNPRKWGLYINPRRMLRVWVRWSRSCRNLTFADIFTVQTSLDSLFQRHMKPSDAPEDFDDWARKPGNVRPASRPEWSWWGDITAENNDLHVAKLQEFRAIVATGDIDPNPAPA